MAIAMGFESVSKKFVVHHAHLRFFQRMVIDLFNLTWEPGPTEFLILEGVSFETPKGEAEQT